jgi:hypothetical protein
MAINLPLVDGWRIKSDSHQYILVREDGQRENCEAFCSSIEHAVQVFVDKKIRGFDATSMNSLIQCIKSLHTRLNKALRPLNLEVVPLSKEVSA